jgi:hypothetical protein
MTKGRRMRIGLCLLAGALFGAPTILVGSSTDAHARHLHRMHSTHFAPALTPSSNKNAVNGAQKLQEHNAPVPENTAEKPNDDKQFGRNSVGNEQGDHDGAARNANTSAGTNETKLPNMKDLGPVDTHITIVRPYLRGPKAETTRTGSSKINSKAGKYWRAGRTLVQHKNRPVVRNTIGVPIAPRDVMTGQRVAPAGMPTGVKGGDGLAKAGPSVGPTGAFHPNAGTAPGVPLTGRGAISGTGFPRRGFVPAGLGGQTKMSGGLSGSTVRPKY